MRFFPTEVNALPYFKEKTSMFYGLINLVLNASSNTTFRFGPVLYKGQKVSSRIFYLLVRTLSAICKNRLARDFFIFLEQLAVKRNASKEWADLLREFSIDAIISNVPNMNVSCISAAMQQNIKRVLIYHTNKDVITSDRFIVPYSTYAVWNKDMQEILVNKFSIPLSKIHLTGCLHFHYLMNGYPEYEQNNVEIFNAHDQNKPVLTYICGALNVENETALFERFLSAVKAIFDDEAVVVLRKNPMETRDIWDKYADGQVKIHEPKWFYDKKKNLNYTFSEDLIEFAQILQRSTAVFGLPSTVVIETALCEKPFINLLYDDCVYIRTTNSMASSLWELPIYSNVRKNKVAIPVKNDNELLEILLQIKNGRQLCEKKSYLDFLASEITYYDHVAVIKAHISAINRK